MQLGTFSTSLAVKDLAASLTFYQKLGFAIRAGNPEVRGGRGFVILHNGGVTIGLFQGMFDRNILTFNPGWDAAGNPLPEFTDVRELQRQLRAAGIEPVTPAEEGAGPTSLVVVDPDGNPILLDQHV